MKPVKYREKLTFIFLMLTLGMESCAEIDCCDQPPKETNTCYLQMFEDFKNNPEALRIAEYRFRNENVYLMETRMPDPDGSHPVINIYCDTICYFGSLSPSSCAKELVYTSLIWQK